MIDRPEIARQAQLRARKDMRDWSGDSPWERWSWRMRIFMIVLVAAWFSPAIIAIFMMFGK